MDGWVSLSKEMQVDTSSKYALHVVHRQLQSGLARLGQTKTLTNRMNTQSALSMQSLFSSWLQPIISGSGRHTGLDTVHVARC